MHTYFSDYIVLGWDSNVFCWGMTLLFDMQQHGRHSRAIPALLIWRKSSAWSKYWRPGMLMKYPYLSEIPINQHITCIDTRSFLYQANWGDEYGRLKSKLDALQKSQRYCRLALEYPYSVYNNAYWLNISMYSQLKALLGEQLDSLTIKELQQLEQQLDSSLKHIRSRKVNWLGYSCCGAHKLVYY